MEWLAADEQLKHRQHQIEVTMRLTAEHLKGEVLKLLDKVSSVKVDTWQKEKGEILVSAGDQLTHLFFIDNGLVGAFYYSDNFKSLVELCGPGDFIGSPLISGQTSALAELKCISSCSGIKLEFNAIRQQLMERGDVFQLLLRAIRDKWMQAVETLTAKAHASIEIRVIRFILMAHDRISEPPLRFTHENLAEYLGARRATISEVMANLQKKNLIEAAGNGRIRVLDAERMASMVAPFYKPTRLVVD